MSRSYATARTSFRKVTHVIFDMDGLLLDTERLYTEATRNIVGRYGAVYDWDLKCELMGMTGEEAARRIVVALDLPLTWDEYYEEARAQIGRLMGNAQLMPDTEGLYRRVIENIAAGFGKRYTPEVRAKLLGTQEVDSSKIAVREMGLPVGWEEFLDKFRTQSNKLLTNCPLMPGAERFIKHLHKNSVPIAVATSSSQESFEIKTQNHRDFFNMFHHTVTGGSDPDVKQGKPSPDIFLVCASRFPDKPKSEDCLVFEDAPNGVTAGITAGMQCVMVPDPEIKHELCEHATLVLPSLEVLKPEQFGLPAFK